MYVVMLSPELTVVLLDQQAQGVFLQVDAAVLLLHKHSSSCMPVVSSNKPSRKTLPQMLRPQYAMKLGDCQCCFLQSDEQKRYKYVDYELHWKHMQHGHKDVFPVTVSFMQKIDLQTGHMSKDGSFAWNLGYRKRLFFASIYFTRMAREAHRS